MMDNSIQEYAKNKVNKYDQSQILFLYEVMKPIFSFNSQTTVSLLSLLFYVDNCSKIF